MTLRKNFHEEINDSPVPVRTTEAMPPAIADFLADLADDEPVHCLNSLTTADCRIARDHVLQALHVFARRQTLSPLASKHTALHKRALHVYENINARRAAIKIHSGRKYDDLTSLHVVSARLCRALDVKHLTHRRLNELNDALVRVEEAL